MNFKEAISYLSHLPELAIDFNKIVKSSQNCKEVFSKDMKPSEVNAKITEGLTVVEKNLGLTGKTANAISYLVKDILSDLANFETKKSTFSKGLEVVEVLPALFTDIVNLEQAAQEELKSLQKGEAEHEKLMKFASIDTAIPATTELLISTISTVCADSPTHSDNSGEL